MRNWYRLSWAARCLPFCRQPPSSGTVGGVNVAALYTTFGEDTSNESRRSSRPWSEEDAVSIRRGDVWSSVMKVSQPLRHQVRSSWGAPREYSDQSINSRFITQITFLRVRNDARPRHRPTRNATSSGMPSAASVTGRAAAVPGRVQQVDRPSPRRPLARAPASPNRRCLPPCAPSASCLHAALISSVLIRALSRNKPFGLAQGARSTSSSRRYAPGTRRRLRRQ